jgi:hypothetical protein
MADYSKIEHRKCSDPLCNRSVTEESRHLCWHCTNFKKRYGVTHSGVLEMRKREGRICYICEKMRKYLVLFGPKQFRICSRCLYLCQTTGDAGWMRRLQEVVSDENMTIV